MESYELDQPLDLRMKPLNYSLGASRPASTTSWSSTSISSDTIPAPIVRQQSLNGRYNCKPCVIACACGPGSTTSLSSTSISSDATSSSTSEASPSPIVRQQSLNGRYNCKPCGIAFSQPETLKAHQEGYCTKTNRFKKQQSISVSHAQ